MWRGLPQSTAARREPTKVTPAVVPIVWHPAGDESAQDAALRAATRAKVRPPEVAPSFSTFRAPSAVRLPERVAAKEESTRQSERRLTNGLTAVKAAAVSEERRKKQAAAARAARERADQAATKVTTDRAQPLQLARASLATSERDRRLRDQPSRLRVPQREPPSEAGRALLPALGVDENDAANTQRSQRKLGGVPHQMPRTVPSSGRLTDESRASGGGGGSGAASVPLMSSGRNPSRTRLQPSHKISVSCRSAKAPWLGIGFDGANADPWGREARDEAYADEEPPGGVTGGEELEVVSELHGDMQLQGLQAKLERVRLLEAMLQSEKEKRGSDENIAIG